MPTGGLVLPLDRPATIVGCGADDEKQLAFLGSWSVDVHHRGRGPASARARRHRCAAAARRTS